MSRYLDLLREKKGFAWYEYEVDPRIAWDVLGKKFFCRSYLMPIKPYNEFLDKTSMDVAYYYVPWAYGRVNKIDEWGKFVYQSSCAKVGDVVTSPDYTALERRLDEACYHKKRPIEWAVYDTANIAIDALGMEEFFWAVKDHPDALLSWMEKIDEFVFKSVDTVSKYPVDVIQISCMLADKNGQFMNDDDMESFVFRFLKRRGRQIKLAEKYFSLHTDGDQAKLFGRFKELGAHIINAYDGHDQRKDMENDFIFHGSIPVRALVTGSPQSIREAVREAVTLGPHVLGSQHDCVYVPVENFYVMLDEIRKYL